MKSDATMFARGNILWGVTLLMLVIAVFGVSAMKNDAEVIVAQEKTPNRPKDTLVLSGETFFVEIMRSREAQAKGLSGRESLPDDHGMLFWFTQDGFYPFWMPDMNFAIDILWIDQYWNVVHIEEGVSPETYPATFSSPVLARYVLELSAGSVERIGANIGQKITLETRAP